MSRILSLFFIFSMLLPCLFILTACKEGNDPATPPATPPQPPEEKAPALYLPTAGSFEGHSTENFSNFVYSAPSTEALLSALALTTERLESEETSYDSALATITALEQVYAEFTSMLSYAQIRYLSNSADAYFSGEYKRLSAQFRFRRLWWSLLVAAFCRRACACLAERSDATCIKTSTRPAVTYYS